MSKDVIPPGVDLASFLAGQQSVMMQSIQAHFVEDSKHFGILEERGDQRHVVVMAKIEALAEKTREQVEDQADKTRDMIHAVSEETKGMFSSHIEFCEGQKRWRWQQIILLGCAVLGGLATVVAAIVKVVGGGA